jgi:hypothetical protein
MASLLSACGDDASSGPDAGPPDAGPPDAAVPPVFRNPVDLPDAELAMQALQLLGADVPDAETNCGVCHGLTRARFRDWLTLSEISNQDCLTNLTVTDRDEAVAMVNCMRGNPADVDSPFSPAKVGYYSTAAHLDWFEYLFLLAYPESGADLHAEFSGRVLMPRGVHLPFDQGQFDIVAEWVARGLPFLDDYVPDVPIPGDCTEDISSAVALHVSEMATEGWRAVNLENGLNMFGCAGAATTRECLASFPLASTTGFGATWAEDLPTSQLRILETLGYSSSYWTRSSADGRYVMHGGDDGTVSGAASTIVDLTDGRLIRTQGFYDPGFFPDNSGWAIQGNRAYFCNQNILATEDFITLTSTGGLEVGCMRTTAVGLYQHLGAALGGGDYWTVDGQFANDNGGHNPTLQQPDTSFDGAGDLDFVPMIHTGSVYEVGTPVSVSTPGEGDGVLSPSMELVVTRVAGAEEYRVREVTATPNGSGGYTMSASLIGTYCEAGGKPGFSMNERWMAIHHYVQSEDAVEMGFTGPSDPAFAPYLSQGAANIYLIDLLNGDKIRVTNMGPGQYALYPHFRADDWMYFIVRTSGSSTEHIVASDAALLAEGQ